ncbi:MAG: NUDIX domain-containing protein [Candidatus Limnocylindrales bacterium]
MPTLPGEALNFCSRCGTALRTGPVDGELRERAHCAACGFIAYRNPRLVVTTLPLTDRGEIVLLRRGIEPGRGSWAQPGGFLEIDETVLQGAIRETLEETGLVVEPAEIVGLYSRPQAAVVVVAFAAPIVGGELRLNEEALEFGTFSPQRIPWAGIAFETTTLALRDWLRRSGGESP